MPTKDELEMMAGKVLYPDPVPYTFLGIKMGILPLPIFYAKRISRRLTGIREQITRMQKAIEKGEQIPEDIDKEIDSVFAEALIDCVEIMFEFYRTKIEGFPLTKEMLEQTATTAQIIDFVMKQLEVNGTSDFLLQPLSMAGLFAQGTAMLWEVFQNLQSSVASARAGESPSIN